MPEILFGHYEVVAVLKRDEKSVSYRVKDQQGRLAYLRAVTENPRETQVALESLRRAARVSHPNLAVISAVEASEQGYYCVREWVEGRPFDPGATGPLEAEEARRILVEACLGVEALHAADAVHGNLGPSNLIERPDRSLVVVDAGLPPRRSFPGGGSAALARYASPEQVLGKPFSPRSDVYQLGLILCEFLTGRPGFSGADAAAAANAQAHQNLTLPGSHRTGVPEDLDDVVAAATAKAPAQRYADASELRSALLADERRLPWKWVGAAAALAVVLLAVVFLALPGDGDTVPAPDLTGLTLEEAGTTLESAGLTLGDVSEEDATEVEPGVILSQDPQPGAEVAVNGNVNVTVASLPEVETPDLSGASEAEAVARLGQAGLRLGEILRGPHEEVQAGFVISQDPGPGSMVLLGSEVSLTVSTGPESPAGADAAVVPNVIGLQEETALQTLEAAGFSTRSHNTESNEPAGIVTEQDPAAGTEVEPGERVTIRVSEGPPDLATVPDVVGLNILDARSAIRDVGLRVNYSFIQEGAPYLEVLAQDPAPGAALPEGSDVTVKLSLPSFSDIPGLN